ncbi:histidine kinase [Flavilitoribacter nigricans]|nr:histidine kinase [Flavilitoribacter nigricans]
MRATITLLALQLCGGLLTAQSVYPLAYPFDSLNSEQERYNDLYTYTQVLVDPTGEWTYEDILARTDQFGPNTTRTDRDLEQVFWVKLKLQDTMGGNHLFSAGYPFGDYALVDLYYDQGDTTIHQQGGAQRLAAEKTIRRSGTYFWVEVPQDTVLTVYLRLDNAAWKNDFWRRYPVSLYHIDPTSVPDLTGAYVLLDFPEDRVAVNTWEPQLSKFPGEFPVPDYWLTEPPKVISLGRYFEYFPDPACQFTLTDVRDRWDDEAFFRGYQIRSFDYNTCNWARLVVINPKPYAQSRTFAYWRYPWREIQYFLPDADGKYQAFTAYPNASQMEAFSLTVQARDTLTLYIRYPARPDGWARNGSLLDVEPASLKKQQLLVKYKFFLCGGMTFFLGYCLIQLILSRDRMLFYYFLMVLGSFPFWIIMLEDGELLGFTQVIYLHLPNPERSTVTALAGTLGQIGLLNFTRIALKLPVTLPTYDRIRKYFIWVVIILGLIQIGFEIWFWEAPGFYANDFHQFLHWLIYNFYSLSAAFILFTVIRAAYKRIPLSGSFLIALLPLCLGIVLISSPFSFVPLLVRQILFVGGLLLPTMLFGIIAAGRSNLLKLEKAQASQQKTQLENQLLQIESKALRAQMNPHFIFNCLNSIKGLIQETANQQAIHYLTLFSKFIRRVLQHSEEKQISLEEELEMSRLYIEMERLRFEKSFTYKVEIDPAVDTSFFRVPPMILQPILENAIWHGLMHKQGDREIRLEVKAEGEGVKCIVEDNGIGRKQAAALQVNTRNEHRSFGTKLILDRLQVNQQLFNHHFVINIIDKIVNGRAAGTRVELSLD